MAHNEVQQTVYFVDKWMQDFSYRLENLMDRMGLTEWLYDDHGHNVKMLKLLIT